MHALYSARTVNIDCTLTGLYTSTVQYTDCKIPLYSDQNVYMHCTVHGLYNIHALYSGRTLCNVYLHCTLYNIPVLYMLMGCVNALYSVQCRTVQCTLHSSWTVYMHCITVLCLKSNV